MRAKFTTNFKSSLEVNRAKHYRFCMSSRTFNLVVNEILDSVIQISFKVNDSELRKKCTNELFYTYWFILQFNLQSRFSEVLLEHFPVLILPIVSVFVGENKVDFTDTVLEEQSRHFVGVLEGRRRGRKGGGLQVL